MAVLQLEDVGLVKDHTAILDDVTFQAADGEFVALIGASGSGKTSVLRVVAGLDRISSGRVLVDGEPVSHRRTAERNVAMVFQTAVMYPFADVAANVAFPLEVQGRPEDEIAERIGAEGRALRIESLFDKDPSELSAGHRQLVQVARAMVRAPDVFLMDEPLASLDSKLRMRMRSELRMVQAGYDVTTLYATNDPSEAMALADRIVVLQRGRVAQIGTPGALYRSPVDTDVAELLGDIDFLSLAVEADGRGFWLVGDGVRLRAWLPALEPFVGRRVIAGIRPNEVKVDANAVGRPVERVVPFGSHDVAVVPLGGATISVHTAPGTVQRSQRIGVRIATAQLFHPDSGVALGRFGAAP